MIKRTDFNSRNLLIILILFVGFILPSALLIGGVYMFRDKSPTPPGKAQEENLEKIITPSDVLSDMAGYSQERITLRGKVIRQPAVCKKLACPAEDRCCGCPPSVGLMIADEIGDPAKEITKTLNLTDINGDSLCRRADNACRYDCGDWVLDNVYDVDGKFYYEAPPPGWRLSLEYYFAVNDKTNIRRAGINNPLNKLLYQAKQLINSLKETGNLDSYILQ
jgi:hypothetical protein